MNAWTACLAVALAAISVSAPGAPTARATFKNPLKLRGADPWMTYYKGYYYLATTTGRDVEVRKARRIADLKHAPDKVVWREDDPTRNQGLWAPEFHRLKGEHGWRWYLYFTACDGEEPNHRMYVAESAGDDPMGPYTFKARMRTDPDDRYYAIDGTVLSLPDGRNYFIWCGRPVPEGQGLFVSRMKNPWTLEGGREHIEASGFGCPVVREGPATLVRNGKAFLIYSMCGADTPDYRLGMMVANLKDDLSKAASWHQHPAVVFARNDEAGVYGPGHNSFFRSPDGKEDWIAYHAKTGNGTTYQDRTARAQPFRWTPGGLPDFGKPIDTHTPIPVPSGEK